MNRAAVLVLAILAASQTSIADEIRRVKFPSALLGTWGETAEKCAAKDKSNILIETAKYSDGSGSCVVRWAVTTPGSRGSNYAVHALCTSAADSRKTQMVNIIIRPQDNDHAVMGRSFHDLKTYQRCPGA
jgi:hypothetical protein